MKPVVVFVEEQSAEILVREICNRLCVAKNTLILVHSGKNELQNSIARKISSYPLMDARFIVLHDNDNTNCLLLKQHLLRLVPLQFQTRTKVRIVCQELEAWYLAQPEALDRAAVLRHPLSKSIMRRDPDSVINPKRELHRLFKKNGQIWLARQIAPHLDVDSVRSRSFSEFLVALKQAHGLK